MKNLIFILLFFHAFSEIFSQSPFRVLVKDKVTNDPIAQAMVLIEELSLPEQMTDRHGMASYQNLPEDRKVIIHVRKKGYKPQKREAVANRALKGDNNIIFYLESANNPKPKTNVKSNIILNKSKYSKGRNIPEDDIDWWKFIKMKDVPGGSFFLGNVFKDEEEVKNYEQIGLYVTLQSYQIGTYEVTQEQWRIIMNYNPSHFSGCDQCPVENVSWNEIQEFLNRLNIKCPSANFRLPTEAEWEYAARGGGKKVRFGNEQNFLNPSEINVNPTESNKRDYSVLGQYRGKTIKVGSLDSPNFLRIHDMSGNVGEWCQDWFGAYLPSGLVLSADETVEFNVDVGLPAIKVKNPKGPETGTSKVVRGGAYDSGPADARVFKRFHLEPDRKSYNLGFRLARSL